MTGRVMGRRWSCAAALVAALSAGTSPARAASPACTPRAEAPRAQLTLLKTQTVDERTRIYSFASAAAGQTVRARVIVPEQYLADPQRRFPVVYHLHGTGNTATTWDLADVKQDVLGTTPVILVLPDGGKTGFYTDHLGMPVGSTGTPPAWDTFHNLELVPWVDQHLRTNGHRAIAGSSMGGYGAIAYPEQHPGLYDAAASLSGAIDIETVAAKAVIPSVYGACIFGDPLIDAANWHAKNPTAHVDRLRGVSLFVQVGNGVPGEYDSSFAPTAPVLELLIHEMNIAGATASAAPAAS
jgi:S-formylglutathione hydrolase FrmB